MIRLSNISLSIKLNLLLLLVSGVLLIATVLLLTFNTGQLTQEIGNERITEEVNIMQKRLAEVEKELSVDVNFVASSIPFIQAVGRRNSETITELLTVANDSLEMDVIVVVDGDGNELVNLRLNEISTTTDETLLASALGGTATTGIFVEDYDGRIAINIGSAAPVDSLRQGTVLGAVQMNRQIDNEFLRELAFERDGIYLGVVYEDQLRAQNTVTGNTTTNILYRDIAFNPESVRLASSGEIIVSDELLTSNNIPYAVAYIPLSINTSGSPATLMILVELDEIFAFQTSTLVNTIIAFAVLSLITLVVNYLSVQQIAIQPLNTLKNIAHQMTAGQYTQRIPIWGKDEVGQLAQSFNEMAEAIHQRETNLQEARAQAERSDQVKSAFLASMSHELRTPLNSIINFSKFVNRGVMGPVNERQTETLNKVINSGKHLLNLINDVLDMSKIESGSMNLFIEDNHSLREIIESAVANAQSLLEDKPVALEMTLADNLPLITGDRQRLYQVVLNVLSNACKFTETGQIQVKARQQHEEILIAISDTGPGIAPEDAEAVFEAFKQTREGIRQGSGTGLGMPISKNLVEAHGGKIWFESVVNQGTTFFISLPVKTTEPVAVGS